MAGVPHCAKLICGYNGTKQRHQRSYYAIQKIGHQVARNSFQFPSVNRTGSSACSHRPSGAACRRHRDGAADESKPIPKEQLEQLVAPIALYPDSLISQILMAATYPIEVVQADRFAKANPKLTGDALTAQLEKEDWDPSVKSLVNFPTVLALMNDKLDSTITLGDAFIDDQSRVLNAIQRLRAKAQAEGNLKTTKEQKVTVEQAPPPDPQVITIEQPPPQIITIEPTNPQVIYVPTYNPTVVYGTWPYPAYPPYPYYPPGYVAAGVIGFGLGVACGAAWGYAWGNCNWGGGDVNINNSRNAEFNRNIDRSKYNNRADNSLPGDRGGNRENGGRDNGPGRGGDNGKFKHDPAHRKGASYRDQSTSQRLGGAQSKQAVQSRDAFRGRADTGRQDLSSGGASQFRGANAVTLGSEPRRSDRKQWSPRTGGRIFSKPRRRKPEPPGQHRKSRGRPGGRRRWRPKHACRKPARRLKPRHKQRQPFFRRWEPRRRRISWRRWEPRRWWSSLRIVKASCKRSSVLLIRTSPCLPFGTFN